MKHKVQQSISLGLIPGLNESLAIARHKQFITRENSLLNLPYDICGIKVRTMTILDYILLERSHSPFISRQEPTLEEIAFFLWALSPEFISYTGRTGWRGWLYFLEPVEAFFHGRKVKRMFGLNMPASSEPAVVKSFEYIDTMFYDSPPALASGQESCLGYLTGWFDAMQSEYHFSSEQVWSMGLPELFQRLNAIRQRNNPNVPQFNKDTDDVKLFILRGLRSKEFTIDDLSSGKVRLPNSANN